MASPDTAIPILPSRSIVDTVAFYQRLGFEGGPHAADSGYAILRQGGVEIHFFHHPELDPATSSAGCYVRVADAAKWHRELALAGLPERGIPRLSEPALKPWGMLEFALVDPDGTLLRIGQQMTAS